MNRKFFVSVFFYFLAFIGAVFAFLSAPLSALWYVVFVLLFVFPEKAGKIMKKQPDICGAVYAGAFTTYFSSFLLLSLIPEIKKTASFLIYLFQRGLDSLLFEFFLVASFYFVLRLFIRSRKIASALTPVPFVFVALLDYYVYNFRGNEIIAADIFSIKTALNVSGAYGFFDFIPIVIMGIPLILYMVTVNRIPLEKDTGKRSRQTGASAICLAVCVVCMAVSLFISSKYHEMKMWKNSAAKDNGIFLNIALSFPAMSPHMPPGYSTDAIDSRVSPAIEGDGRDPNIIIIMNEAMTDVTYSNTLDSYIEDPMPYMHSLAEDREHTVSGYALSSVYGGNTANSEFEMLTGITTAYLPSGAIPYTLYIDRPIISVASVLRDQGYDTVAMHPYPGDGWSRDKVYPLLGFDDSLFMDDFRYDDSDMIRTFDSDMNAYENLLRVIDEHEASSDAPLFSFLVTVQNHGGYDDPTDNYVPGDYIQGHDDANLFISLMHETDNALEYLIGELEQRDEEYVLLIFGDHHPALPEFSDDMTPGGEAWKIPFLIWSNKGLTYNEAYSVRDGAGVTDIGYLGLETLLYAGSDIPSYFSTIMEIRDNVPSINAAGFYSLSGNTYRPLKESDEDGASAYIELYRYLQYDVLFDENDSGLTTLH